MWFDQSPYQVKVEWGRRGAREAAERGDIVIVIDVLSFSTTVVTALEKGSIIYPYPPNMDGKAYADRIGAEFILGRAESIKIGQPTLSPVTFSTNHRNKKFVLTSLNGAFCSWIAKSVPALLVGSLLNAKSVASVANKLQKETKANITLVPCGEQWNDVREHEDTLRPSIEDYLGAGAILSYLVGKKSPEAEFCLAAYLASNGELQKLLLECGSGRELRERGFEADVFHASRLNFYQTVPILKDDYFVKFEERGVQQL